MASEMALVRQRSQKAGLQRAQAQGQGRAHLSVQRCVRQSLVMAPPRCVQPERVTMFAQAQALTLAQTLRQFEQHSRAALPQQHAVWRKYCAVALVEQPASNKGIIHIAKQQHVHRVINLSHSRVCMRSKDWRAHGACVPRLRQRRSFSRTLLSQKQKIGRRNHA